MQKHDGYQTCRVEMGQRISNADDKHTVDESVYVGLERDIGKRARERMCPKTEC